MTTTLITFKTDATMNAARILKDEDDNSDNGDNDDDDNNNVVSPC